MMFHVMLLSTLFLCRMWGVSYPRINTEMRCTNNALTFLLPFLPETYNHILKLFPPPPPPLPAKEGGGGGGGPSVSMDTF